MTFLDAPLQVSSEQTTTMINRKNRLTDLALTGESFETRADADPYFTKSQAAALIRPYLNATDPKNPLVSPLYADLTGLPPIRIHVGDDEVLLDDSRRYLERALAAGVDAELDIWMGMPHGFVTNVIGFNAAAQALQATGAFLERVISESPNELRKEIRRRAYEIYLGRGREPGREIDDWLQAERELTRDRSKAPSNS